MVNLNQYVREKYCKFEEPMGSMSTYFRLESGFVICRLVQTRLIELVCIESGHDKSRRRLVVSIRRVVGDTISDHADSEQEFYNGLAGNGYIKALKEASSHALLLTGDRNALSDTQKV
jgi:hypothetical protein